MKYNGKKFLERNVDARDVARVMRAFQSRMMRDSVGEGREFVDWLDSVDADVVDMEIDDFISKECS